MMNKIACPKCGHSFELTDAVAGPLVAKAQQEAAAEADRRIEAARLQLQAEASQKATEASQNAIAAALEAAKKSEASRLAVEARLQEYEAKLTTAQAAQADALASKRKLEEERRELELTIQQRVNEGLTVTRQAAERAAEERLAGQVAERDATIASMAKTVEDLRRKAEQGSQQTQGEAQELALEAALTTAFPSDQVEPVGKGVSGGDVVQHVVSPAGPCGKILWESKNTKAWSAAWLPKLRDDGRAASAELLVLVSTALPKDMATEFGLVEGVWVCLPKHAVSLASALRQALAEVSSARSAGQGLETKAGLAYGYLVGPKFKARVSAIVEAFTAMREDLESERRAIQKQWAKREAQIERVLGGTVGMYGDLQAIAGRSLSEIEGLELKT